MVETQVIGGSMSLRQKIKQLEKDISEIKKVAPSGATKQVIFTAPEFRLAFVVKS